MQRLALVLVWICLLTQAAVGGERLTQFELNSRFLKAPRTIRVYLPPTYFAQSARRYAVLYAHDGQNLFSAAGTNICFGWGSWELDKTLDELSGAGKMREVILVAVDNSAARYEEYCGRHRQESSAAATAFENYSQFLIRELKPRIDAEYRTRAGAADTGVLGSSMGGICSIVLAWDHPEVFGKAASLSGAFQVPDGTNFIQRVLHDFHGPPKVTRLYLDSGVVDFMGGDDGRKWTAAAAAEFQHLGWAQELRVYTDARPLTLDELKKSGLRQDKWKEAQTSQHNEFYWRLRVWRALTFLFPPQT